MNETENLITRYYYFLCTHYAGTKSWKKLRDDMGKYLNSLSIESQKKYLDNAKRIHERYNCS